MSSFAAYLEVSGNRYSLHRYELSMYQETDALGRPASPVLGGKIDCMLAVTASQDSFLDQWMLSPTLQKDGLIRLLDPLTATTFKTINFFNAYCTGMDLHFLPGQTGGAGSTLLHLQISPQRIAVGAIIHDNNWPVESHGAGESHTKPEIHTLKFEFEPLSSEGAFPVLHVKATPIQKDTRKTIGSGTEHQIDYEWIGELEGNETKGYIPKDEQGNPLDNSGVTIGKGVDLGQMSKQEINDLPISQELKNKLMGFANKQKQDAVNYLKNNPLEITKDEANELNTVIRDRSAAILDKAYKEATGGMEFADLPAKIQTTVASTSFQYGNLAIECPKYWSYIINNQWAMAEKELRNFGDKYPTRRRKEADLLREGIEELSPNSGHNS